MIKEMGLSINYVVSKLMLFDPLPLLLFFLLNGVYTPQRQHSFWKGQTISYHSQSRYNRVYLSPISNMDFQFWTIWAAQGWFIHVGSKQANPQVFGCKCKSINNLRNVPLYLFFDVTYDYREHPENSQLYVPEICHWLFYPKHYILGPYELVINNDAIKNESVSSIPQSTCIILTSICFVINFAKIMWRSPTSKRKFEPLYVQNLIKTKFHLKLFFEKLY